jgi:hypothetical protein
MKPEKPSDPKMSEGASERFDHMRLPRPEKFNLPESQSRQRNC